MSAKQSPTADGGSAGRPKKSFSHEPMEEEESLYSFVRFNDCIFLYQAWLTWK